MFVTVLICTYNRAESLRVTLETLFRQETPEYLRGDWEILVVDNNSTDGTQEVVEAFARLGEPAVRYLFEPRQGKSYALNSGILEAGGAIVAFTDDDVLIDRNWVASVARAARLYPQYRAFGGRVLPRWPERVPVWIQPRGPYARPIVGGPIVSHDRGEDIREYGRGMWAPIGANMFFRKRVFAEYGPFRIDLCPTGAKRLWVNEDCEFCFRLMHDGEKILYYPEALVIHPVPVDKLSRRYLRDYFLDAGMKRARQDSPAKMTQRLKWMAKSTLFLTGRILGYLWHRLFGDPAAAMHHQCRMYFFAARTWYLLQPERTRQ